MLEQRRIQKTQLGLFLSALLLSSMSPVLKVASQVHGVYMYNENMVYFCAELLKLFVAMCFIDAHSVHRVSLEDHMRFAITGLLFFLQNNLGFLVLKHISPGSFTVLLNMRVVLVGLFSSCITQARINHTQWCSVILLSAGGMQHWLSVQTSIHHEALKSYLGLLAIMVTSALANVYNQYTLQLKAEMPLMLQNSCLYFYGVCFNGVNWGNSVLMAGMPVFGVVSNQVILLILFSVMYGLCISAVLKEFGALVRSIIGYLAISLTVMIDFTVSGQRPSLLTFSAHVVILVASHLYDISR